MESLDLPALTCELAWLWLRYQPDSDLSVWFRARVGTVKGRIRRIAIVALARKLLVALWRYLKLAWCRGVPSSRGDNRSI